jgi:GNAT superfamily N-acetyltransferase
LAIVVIENIQNENAHFYKEFTFKQYEKFLLDEPGDTPIVKIGARVDGVPAGLALAKEDTSTGNIWNILSFFVLENFRKKGAGAALLSKLKEILLDKKCEFTTFKVITSMDNIKSLESLFVKHGFAPFRICTNIYKCSIIKMREKSPFSKRVFSGKLKFNKNVKILLKNQVDTNLIEKIKAREDNDYPESLSPFKNEFDLKEAFHFFAITENDGIIGWGTTFEAPGNLILYRSFFVKKEYRPIGVGYNIFNACFKYQCEHYPGWDFIFAVAVDNKRTEKLLGLYLGDSFDWFKHECETSLTLKNKIKY